MQKRDNKFFFLALLCFVFCGCTTPALREADAVVAKADSLWREGKMYGIDAGDSVSLAQAYETLKKHSAFSVPFIAPSPWERAGGEVCYHYGRLLREKDNPVAAMQVFIDATHSRTRDYHILGRVYSNMGDLCHLAGDFPLSYDMFSRSADCFLKNGDTLLYYYGLNNMAFELAEQKKGKEVVALLYSIENNHSYPVLQTNIQETKMVLYKKLQQYDSVLYYANLLQSNRIKEPTVYLSKAQAFCYTYQYDSATYYADLTTNISKNLFHLNNAYYILIHCDSVHNGYKVYALSAKRADVQKQLEVRQGQMSQAVQLLEQDLQRKPDWRKWVILFFVVLLCFTAFCVPYILRRHKQQMKKQVTILSDKQATNIIDSIKKHIDTTDINSTLHWKNYKEMKMDVDLYMGGLVSKLETHHLNEVEIRFCILTLLDFRLKRIAETLNYSYPSGIKTLKKRTSDKLETTPLELKNYLLHKL